MTEVMKNVPSVPRKEESGKGIAILFFLLSLLWFVTLLYILFNRDLNPISQSPF